MTTHMEAEALLRAMGERPDEAIDLGEAALLLGSFDRPRVGLQRYRDHLAALADDTAAMLRERGDGGLADRIAALNAVIVGRYGYAGDTLTYDDLQNANLLRVIDRRKGLPVALGILYLSTAERLGWQMAGLNFPGHFLVRLDLGGARAILDPFDRGRPRGAPELREMLKAAAGPGAELAARHYAPVGKREVLLRLQNNIKVRRLKAGDLAGALASIEDMLRLVPDAAPLWREAGLVNERLDRPRAAIACLERFLAFRPGGEAETQARAALAGIRTRLN